MVLFVVCVVSCSVFVLEMFVKVVGFLERVRVCLLRVVFIRICVV